MDKISIPNPFRSNIPPEANDLIVSQRQARFFQLVAEKPVAVELKLNALDHRPAGIENPFVITTLVAGLTGVTLSIIILLSIWILKRGSIKRQKKRAEVERCQPIEIAVSKTTSPASHSTTSSTTAIENHHYVPPCPMNLPQGQLRSERNVQGAINFPKETPV